MVKIAKRVVEKSSSRYLVGYLRKIVAIRRSMQNIVNIYSNSQISESLKIDAGPFVGNCTLFFFVFKRTFTLLYSSISIT